MTRYLFTIKSDVDKQRIIKYVSAAPVGTRVELKAAKRSIDQNSKLWAMLTEVADQLPWHGVKLRADDFKLLFLDALKREVRAIPNLDGTGWVNLGQSSSDLTKSEMGDLIELMHEFGARHGVKFADEDEWNKTLVKVT